jgi:NADPH:quinone reductase-like Zn-dependent oxidoreductase
MRAAVHRRFGGPEVVSVEEVPAPEPGADDILVRVRASTVSVADHRARSRELPRGLGALAPIEFGVRSPRHPILGRDVVGVVASVGPRVTTVRPGDEVIAMLGPRLGAHAEYVCLPAASAICRKPDGLSCTEAASLVFGGHTALAFLDRGDVRSGQEVLVNGASGAVGSALVQLAVHRGAVVTAVCSRGNADLVRSLGAHRVIDYTEQDFARDGSRYDVVAECVGNAPFERVQDAIRPGGAYLPIITDLRGMLRSRGAARRTGVEIAATAVAPSVTVLTEVARLAELGALRPVIDSTFELDDIVDAHRRVATGRKRGSVALSI